MITIILHILNDDPVLAEIESMPNENTSNILVQNPRLRDGKPLQYLDRDVTKVLWPMHRINYIEFVSQEEEEEIVTFVRE